MYRSARAILALLCVTAALTAAACGTSPADPADTTVSGGCSSDIACPYGEECGTGACVAIAPSLYPHIQTASALFRDHLDGAEVTWRGAHYDLLINRVLDFAHDFRAINPNVRLLEYMYSRYNNYDDFGNRATEWALAHGYDPEDFYLHYREDVTAPTWEGIVLVPGYEPGLVPGWNPDWPDDPNASATTRAEARVPGYNVGHEPWFMANINHQGYRRFLLDWAEDVMGGAGDPIDGIVFDNAIYYPMFGEGQLDKTDEYYGTPVTADHPHAMGFASLYPEITNGLSERYGRGIDITPNFGHVLFLSRPEPAPVSVIRNVPWIWAEVWLSYYFSDAASGTNRTVTWEGDYQKGLVAVIEQTRGSGRRILGARDYSNGELGTDRGRLLTLALYYLIQNRNTFYLYETVPHHSSDLPMEQWSWNAAVEFDIGQPDQVPSGTTDYAGDYPSDEHYVFATGPDPSDNSLTYRVLARRYTNALVLAKLLPAGSTIGPISATVHDLDGEYAPLQADGTLGPVVTQVSIRNNEGMILIPVD
jgi:hypothetical protein